MRFAQLFRGQEAVFLTSDDDRLHYNDSGGG
jgi:hypothetical protein